MQILTMPGCPRARNVKQLLKEYGIPAAERGLYQVLCDAQKYRPLIEEMAAHYGCTPQELIESPSRISRPFLVVSPAEQSSRQDFFQALKERDFYPNYRNQKADSII